MTQQTRDQERFVIAVSNKADIEPDEAEELIREFLSNLSEFVDDRAWEVISEIAPLTVERRETRAENERTMKTFLVSMSGEEEVETRRAARDSRAVAETIRERADDNQVETLESSLEEDFLALFESRGRGELTEPDSLTSEVQEKRRPPSM